MTPQELREMPSSLNDACRKLELAADRIERLLAVVKGIIDVWDAEDHPVPMPNLRRAIESARDELVGAPQQTTTGK